MGPYMGECVCAEVRSDQIDLEDGSPFSLSLSLSHHHPLVSITGDHSLKLCTAISILQGPNAALGLDALATAERATKIERESVCVSPACSHRRRDIYCQPSLHLHTSATGHLEASEEQDEAVYMHICGCLWWRIACLDNHRASPHYTTSLSTELRQQLR